MAQAVGPTRWTMPLAPCAILRDPFGGHQCLLQRDLPIRLVRGSAGVKQ